MINRVAAGVVLACLLAIACSRPSHADPSDRRTDAASRAQGAASEGAAAAPEGDEVSALGFDLVNFTGSALSAVYISPSDSQGWEENVLAGSELNDGDTADIRFSPEERASRWDIRVEGADGHYADWKGLDLRGVSRITLLLSLVGGPAVVAEVE